jgi:hypothetical protein
MQASLVGYVLDGTTDLRQSSTVTIAAGETGRIDIAVKHANGAAYDLGGAQLLLTVERAGAVIISRQATIDSAAAGAGHFPLVVADTLAHAGACSFDVWLTAPDGSRYQVVRIGKWNITPSEGQPGQIVTVPAEQEPLALGPAGAAGTTLPPQTGNAGKVLGTNGSVLSWVDQSGGGGGAAFSTLYCNGNGQHVNHGPFWGPGGRSLGNAMTWEAWFMGDLSGSQYIVSDGYGGAHALLWSGVSGNINFKDGGGVDQIISFASSSSLVANVFNHCRVRLLVDDFGNIFILTDVNGISVGKVQVPAGYVRSVYNGAGGQGTLYVMGSDHSNKQGWLAQMRAWDDQALADAVIPGMVYQPDRVFGAFSNYGPAGVPAQFLPMYITPPGTTQFMDLGAGYDSHGGFAAKFAHPGYAAGGNDTYAGSPPVYPLPTAVAVPTPTVQAPFYSGYIETPVDRGYTPLTPPVGAKRYDSFSRPDQTYAHVAVPSAGSTESGSLGPAAWQARTLNGGGAGFPSLLQIFDRSLRVGDVNPVLAYVPNASNVADMTVVGTRIDPSSGFNDGTLGVSARVAADGSSCFYAFYQYIPGSQSVVYLYRMDAPGALGFLGNAAVSLTGWSQLKLKCQGSTISVFTDGVQIISVTDSTLATQRGGGCVFTNLPSSTHMAVKEWALF